MQWPPSKNKNDDHWYNNKDNNNDNNIDVTWIGNTVGYSRAHSSTFWGVEDKLENWTNSKREVKVLMTHVDDVNPGKLHLDAGLVVVARRHPEEVVERLLDVLRPRQVAVQGLQDLGLGPETGHS